LKGILNVDDYQNMRAFIYYFNLTVAYLDKYKEREIYDVNYKS